MFYQWLPLAQDIGVTRVWILFKMASTEPLIPQEQEEMGRRSRTFDREIVFRSGFRSYWPEMASSNSSAWTKAFMIVCLHDCITYHLYFYVYCITCIWILRGLSLVSVLCMFFFSWENPVESFHESFFWETRQKMMRFLARRLAAMRTWKSVWRVPWKRCC